MLEHCLMQFYGQEMMSSYWPDANGTVTLTPGQTMEINEKQFAERDSTVSAMLNNNLVWKKEQ